MVRLVKFLEGGKNIEQLTVEEAEYFHGVLNQKLNKAMYVERQKKELLAQDKLFMT